MTDRNDKLLLALGFRLETREIAGCSGMCSTRWIHSDGREFPENFNPRGNLQDAMDCVPEGLEVQLKWRSGGDYGHAVLHNPDTDAMHFAMQDTPAEALAEVIMKAVSHD